MQRFRDLRVRAEGGGAMTTENEFGRTEPSVAEELLMLAQAIAKVIIYFRDPRAGMTGRGKQVVLTRNRRGPFPSSSPTTRPC